MNKPSYLSFAGDGLLPTGSGTSEDVRQYEVLSIPFFFSDAAARPLASVVGVEATVGWAAMGAGIEALSYWLLEPLLKEDTVGMLARAGISLNSLTRLLELRLNDFLVGTEEAWHSNVNA
tara:strand:- start:132 stop:491 length:360 start_codon:yes stop_codon:yes gene_type:complete